MCIHSLNISVHIRKHVLLSNPSKWSVHTPTALRVLWAMIPHSTTSLQWVPKCTRNGTKSLCKFQVIQLRCVSPDTSLLWLVDRLVGLNKDSCPFAVHRHSGGVVEDVTSLCQVPVTPDLQLGLASQSCGDLNNGEGRREDKRTEQEIESYTVQT